MKNAYIFQLFQKKIKIEKNPKMKIQNEKIQNEKIPNEKIQNEKIQNEKIQNKIINISAQRQRFRLVVCVAVYVLNEPVQTFNI